MKQRSYHMVFVILIVWARVGKDDVAELGYRYEKQNEEDETYCRGGFRRINEARTVQHDKV